MKTILIFASIWLSCYAVEEPTLYEDAVVKPSGTPQFIHASLPDSVSKAISNRPKFEYISNSFGGFNYGGLPQSYAFNQQSGTQVGYQYVRKPTVQVQQRYPFQQVYPLQQLYYPPRYQYETRYYPQYIAPSYGYIFPWKK